MKGFKVYLRIVKGENGLYKIADIFDADDKIKLRSDDIIVECNAKNLDKIECMYNGYLLDLNEDKR